MPTERTHHHPQRQRLRPPPSTAAQPGWGPSGPARQRFTERGVLGVVRACPASLCNLTDPGKASLPASSSRVWAAAGALSLQVLPLKALTLEAAFRCTVPAEPLAAKTKSPREAGCAQLAQGHPCPLKVPATQRWPRGTEGQLDPPFWRSTWTESRCRPPPTSTCDSASRPGARGMKVTHL